MKCPYCRNEVNGSVLFFLICRQSLSKQTNENQATQAYWDEYQKKTSSDISYTKTIAARTKYHNRKARNATVTCIALCCAVIEVIIVLVMLRINSNNSKLAAVHRSMIGETYDDVRENSFWVGESCDRRVATITGYDSLEFEEGNYKSYTDSAGNTAWRTNEIYRTATYSYELSISFTGKIYMHVGGGKFEVELTDEGSVWAIRFYG